LIVIFVDKMEDFLDFYGTYSSIIKSKIFYEYNKNKNQVDYSSKAGIEIILNFLSKVGEVFVLFETKINFSMPESSNIDEEIVAELQRIFNKIDPSLSLIKGKIREIFLSYTS